MRDLGERMQLEEGRAQHQLGTGRAGEVRNVQGEDARAHRPVLGAPLAGAGQMRDAAEEVVECSSVVALLAASRLARHGNEAIDRIVLLERKVGHHEGVVICAAGLALLEADWDLHAHTRCRRPDLVEPGL